MSGGHSSTHHRPSQEDMAKRQEQAAASQAEIAKEQAETASKAQAIWKAAVPAPADHPYIVRKGVEPTGTLREIDVQQAAQILEYQPQAVEPVRSSDASASAPDTRRFRRFFLWQRLATPLGRTGIAWTVLAPVGRAGGLLSTVQGLVNYANARIDQHTIGRCLVFQAHG